MTADLSSIERSIGESVGRLQAAREAVSALRAELRCIDEAIAECLQRIEDLVEERDGLEEEEEGSDDDTHDVISELIEQEDSLSSELHEQQGTTKAALRDAIAIQKICRGQVSAALRHIEYQLRKHVGNVERLEAVAFPHDALGAGRRLQDTNAQVARRLQRQQLILRSELRGESAVEDDVTYVPIAGVRSWEDAVPAADGTPTLIHPIDAGRDFCDVGDGTCIPVDYHDVTDTIRPTGPSSQDKEAFGVAYAREYLRTQGHLAIADIGGRDAPDILSLAIGVGGGSRLVVTEVKGTAKGARIDEMNLTATLADGSVRHENHRDHLRKNGNVVLMRLSRQIEACSDPQQRQRLMAVRSEFGRMNQRGFVPGEYETQVIQVGWVDSTSAGAQELRPATLIDRDGWRDYLQEVRPNRIVQLNVHSGSEQARTESSSTLSTRRTPS